MTSQPERLIQDDEIILSVTTQYGSAVRFWDEGFGPLWVLRDALGVIGVVRAQTWEDAWECCVDEILPDADETDPENLPDEDGNLPEGVYYRGSGVPSNEGLRSALAQEDPNGCSLDILTPTLADDIGLDISFAHCSE